ncbi:CDC50-LEM3 family [Babesia duncani]|uniref:CDC50-LEM3 family n=1 Tax=Babesia duncani TaxID=323732 RepID=A0AAD9UPX4_9APIC|nr:CDC50-LEM3 family [Babesia duncani]
MAGEGGNDIMDEASISDVTDTVYHDSLDYVTQKHTRKSAAAQLLSGPEVKAPKVQGASVIKPEDVTQITGMVGLDGKAKKPEYLWLPSRKEIGTGYRNRLERYMQMDFKRTNIIYLLYTPKVASCVFLGLGLLMLTICLLFPYNTAPSPILLRYSENKGSVYEFDIPKDLPAPVYFYYRIENFYINHKRVAYESSPGIITHGKCSKFKTFKEILDLRCINGKNTLNGNHQLCKDYENVPEFQLPAYPCGAISATLMTDNFEICDADADLTMLDVLAKDDDMQKNCIHLSQRLDVNNWNFIRYNVKKSITEKGFHWLDTTSTLFRSWTDFTFDSTFLKPYAVSYKDIKAGTYRLYITTNLWPADAWQAKKSVYITCVGRFGGSSPIFEIIMFIVAIVYICTGLCIFAFYKIKGRLNKDPWSGIDVVKVDYGDAMVKGDKVIETITAYDVNKVPKSNKSCLCPCKR